MSHPLTLSRSRARTATALAVAGALALVAALLTMLGAGGETSSAAAAPAPARTAAAEAPGQLRDVMFVGNNWDGTASIVDARSHEVLRRGIDLVPDLEQELSDIYTSPDRLAFYLAIQQGPGEGHDQLVDDMYSTPNGRYLAVSRPSLGDVVWIDIARRSPASPAASCASSRWTATAPTTWASPPTAPG